MTSPITSQYTVQLTQRPPPAQMKAMFAAFTKAGPPPPNVTLDSPPGAAAAGATVVSPLSPANLYALQPSPPSAVFTTQAPAAVLAAASPVASVIASSAAGGQPTSPVFVDVSSPRMQQVGSPVEIKTEPQAYSPTPSTGVGSAASPAGSANSSFFPPGGSPLTPTGAVHQYAQMQQEAASKKKHNSGGGSNSGAGGKPQEELCLVCGDRASGYHYNALACEGCKGFFRRSITKNSSYACKYGDGCEIDMYMRRKCQACRLKKCYQVGMRAECVVPESQCQKKRQAKQAQRAQVSAVGAAANENSNGADAAAAANNGVVNALAANALRNRLADPPRALKPEEEELINRIVFYQDEYENPTEEDLNRVYHVPMHQGHPAVTMTPTPNTNSPGGPGGSPGELENESDKLFRHMTEMTILTVQLIVEFSKHLPGFQTLCRDDQVSLLKACSSEVMMIRGARRYDPQRESIIYATNYPFSKDNYDMAGLGNDALFRFCKHMCNMKVDNAEYALLTAIVIFSERENVKEPKRVEKIQEIYVEALQSYVMARRKRDHMVAFAKLLSVLTTLRSLGNNNAKTCFNMKMVNRKLPAFLAEIWDIK